MNITRRLQTITFDLEGDIEQVIANIQHFPKKYPGYTQYKLEVEDEWDGERQVRNVLLRGVRPETPEEENARLAVDLRRQKMDEERERNEFERLKKKFGESQ